MRLLDSKSRGVWRVVGFYLIIYASTLSDSDSNVLFALSSLILQHWYLEILFSRSRYGRCVPIPCRYTLYFLPIVALGRISGFCVSLPRIPQLRDYTNTLVVDQHPKPDSHLYFWVIVTWIIPSSVSREKGTELMICWRIVERWWKSWRIVKYITLNWALSGGCHVSSFDQFKSMHNTLHWKDTFHSTTYTWYKFNTVGKQKTLVSQSTRDEVLRWAVQKIFPSEIPSRLDPWHPNQYSLH